MKRIGGIASTLACVFGLNCGFLSEARVSKAYIEELAPESPEACLVTWPIHAIGLPVAAAVDQLAIRTVEVVPPAATDTVDYFFYRGDGDNFMLRQAAFVPKTLLTPFVFVASYLTRWLVPIDADSRPFAVIGEEGHHPDDDGTGNIEEPPRPEEEE